MSKILLSFLLFFTGLYPSFTFSQEIEGEWKVTKMVRLYNGERTDLYNYEALDNILNYPETLFSFNSDGTYTGTRGDDQSTSGAWSIEASNFTMSGVSLPLTIIDIGNFYTTRDVSFRHYEDGKVTGQVEVYYTSTSALPVTLQSFILDQNKKAAFLSWVSAEEEGFSLFEIEKSLDGQTFSKVGEVNATGSNSGYNFEDQEAFVQATTVFYRLKMVDHDDSFRYSQVKSISTIQEEVEVFPNPTRSIVNYRQPPNTAATYKVLDINGKLLSSGEARDSGTIDLASLPKGAYHLIFLKGKKAIHYDRVLKL